jgi:hypothetical protein
MTKCLNESLLFLVSELPNATGNKPQAFGRQAMRLEFFPDWFK